MYSKIPAKIKPTTTSNKLTYASAFDFDLCLLLRERRCATLADMQDAALEVESNIMATEKLKGNVARGRQRGESSSSSDPKIDKMTKMIESLASEISKLKVEKHPGKRRVPNTFALRNPNPYRRANEQLQILQRSKDASEDQRVKTHFQNVVMEEEQFDEDDEIHCIEDKGSASFLTLSAYEKSLFNDQISQEWDGGVVLQTGDQHGHDLRSKMNNVKETLVQKVFVLAIQQANKQKRPIVDPIILKAPTHEVRGLDKSPSPLSFQS